jgi:hypothetical protein
MTPAQTAVISRLLSSAKLGTWLNHGDCEGSDEEVHRIAMDLGYNIRLHPPENPKQRAYCNATEVEPPQPYSIRNQNIVRVSNVVVIAPFNKSELHRGSGTWQVVRLARKRKKPYVIVFPDGQQDGGNHWENYFVS